MNNENHKQTTAVSGRWTRSQENQRVKDNVIFNCRGTIICAPIICAPVHRDNMADNIYNNFNGYHNRKSIRLQGYDYSQPGYYFITICTGKHAEPLFGEIKKQQMILNEYGNHAQQCWGAIPQHFPNVIIDEHIIMPDHVHGIVRIVDHTNTVGVQNVGVQNVEPLQNDTRQNKHQNQFQHIIPHSIGSIIRGFKIGVTKLIRRQQPGMVVWQRGYYEHIIRNEKSLFNIRNYIRNNPRNITRKAKNLMRDPD